MFFRRKTSGGRNYLQIVENKWEDGKTRQRVIANLGRMEQLVESGSLEALLKSGQKYIDAAKQAEAAGGDGEGTKRIFVVDDEPWVMPTIQSLMEQQGSQYEVDGCSDGVEALVRIGMEMPDLVLLDIYMNGIDGFEVCRRLRSMTHLEPVKVVAMTSFPSEEARARIMDHGALAYWTKPVQAEDIVAILDGQGVQSDKGLTTT